jgi:membrane dipeptidase
MIPLFALWVALPADAPSDVELHRRAIVVDAHTHTAQLITDGGADLTRGSPEAMVDLPKMRQGGLDAQFFAIWVEPADFPRERFFAETERQIAAVRALTERSGGAIALARTAAEVRQNARQGRLSALLGIEGGHSLEPGSEAEQLARLRHLGAEGVRYLTLTWAKSNALGGSAGDQGETEGLTAFGRRAIDEMQELGMVVDLSHASDPMFWDVIRYVKKPVLASHSAARELVNLPRNLSDPMLRAVAKNGGAVCINFYSAFLDADFNRAMRAVYPKAEGMRFLESERFLRAEARKLRPVPLSRLIDHIDHVAKVAGIDHVCLGSDFDGIPAPPAGMEDASHLPALTALLRQRGYSPEAIEKILGGNTLRVLEANEVHTAAGSRR